MLPKATILPVTSQLLLSDLANSRTSSHSIPLSLNAQDDGDQTSPETCSAVDGNTANSFFTKFNFYEISPVIQTWDFGGKSTSPVPVAFCLHKDSVIVASKAQLSGTLGFP